jgi:hypothetical protein
MWQLPRNLVETITYSGIVWCYLAATFQQGKLRESLFGTLWKVPTGLADSKIQKTLKTGPTVINSSGAIAWESLRCKTLPYGCSK